jgi:hypothetical protein
MYQLKKPQCKSWREYLNLKKLKKSKKEEQRIKPEKRELSIPETETQIQRYLESERCKKLTELKELLKEKENELANIDNEFTQKEALARKEIDAEYDPKINEIKVKLDSEQEFLNEAHKKIAELRPKIEKSKESDKNLQDKVNSPNKEE